MHVLGKVLDLGSTSLTKAGLFLNVPRDGLIFSPSLRTPVTLLLAPSCLDHLPFSLPLFPYVPHLSQAQFLDGTNGARDSVWRMIVETEDDVGTTLEWVCEWRHTG